MNLSFMKFLGLDLIAVVKCQRSGSPFKGLKNARQIPKRTDGNLDGQHRAILALLPCQELSKLSPTFYRLSQGAIQSNKWHYSYE